MSGCSVELFTLLSASLEVELRNHSCSIAYLAWILFLLEALNILSIRSMTVSDIYEFHSSSEKSLVLVIMLSSRTSSFSPLKGSLQVIIRIMRIPTDQMSHL